MTEPTTKRPRGCFFYGCLSGIVVLVLLLIGGLVGLHYFKKMFNELTDSQPAPLPANPLSQAQMDQVRERVDLFRQAVRAGRATEPLTLNSDEINALIATDPNLQGLKDKIYVTLQGDQMTGLVSIRLEELGLGMFKNRYLNATGTFFVSLTNGVFDLRAQSITVKRKSLPEVYMDKIRQRNLAQGINQDPRASIGLSKLEQIKVQDGKLVIIPKAAP